MQGFKSFITEEVDTLQAHVECAEAGIPLPDKALKITHHRFNDFDDNHRYRYEKPDGGFVVHSPFDNRTDSMITHHNAAGQIHRDDGPAQYVPGKNTVSYYKNGVEIGGRYPLSFDGYTNSKATQNRYWKHSDNPRHEGLGEDISREEHDRLFPYKPSHSNNSK